MNFITDIPHNQRISATLRIPEQTQNIRDDFFVELSQLDEKFAPQGAENILDAVNKSTEWNGRLEDAYKELFTLLDCIRAIQSDEQFNDYETSLASVFHSVGDYTEGSTNLTYLFADKEKKTIYTN